MTIKYLRHNEIDKVKWDNCIHSSENHIIYTLSWYLDIVCPGWDALVADDYQVVMPLPWKKKYGFTYLYKPLFIQQLGIFGNDISVELLNQFLNSIPRKFLFADIRLNEKNKPENQIGNKSENSNYKLSLQATYQEIQKKYNRNCNRNIKKAKEAGFAFRTKINSTDFLNLLVDQIKQQTTKFGIDEVHQLNTLVNYIVANKKGEIIGIIDNSGNLAAAGFYLFSFDSIIFLICGSTEAGKEHQAMYLLVDEQIKRYSGKYKWYDFSGSNIKGIAYFNSTFGAELFTYYTLTINRLPWPINRLKAKLFR